MDNVTLTAKLLDFLLGLASAVLIASAPLLLSMKFKVDRMFFMMSDPDLGLVQKVKGHEVRLGAVERRLDRVDPGGE